MQLIKTAQCVREAGLTAGLTHSWSDTAKSSIIISASSSYRQAAEKKEHFWRVWGPSSFFTDRPKSHYKLCFTWPFVNRSFGFILIKYRVWSDRNEIQSPSKSVGETESRQESLFCSAGGICLATLVFLSSSSQHVALPWSETGNVLNHVQCLWWMGGWKQDQQHWLSFRLTCT